MICQMNCGLVRDQSPTVEKLFLRKTKIGKQNVDKNMKINRRKKSLYIKGEKNIFIEGCWISFYSENLVLVALECYLPKLFLIS